MSNVVGGRPSKGARDAIAMRTPPELAEALYFRGLASRLTPGEYAVALLAEHLGEPDYVPAPSVRKLSVIAEPTIRDDGYAMIKLRPHPDLGGWIRLRARQDGMSFGAWAAKKVAEIISTTPEKPSETLFDSKGGKLVAA